jgi:hypothetical protein
MKLSLARATVRGSAFAMTGLALLVAAAGSTTRPATRGFVP